MVAQSSNIITANTNIAAIHFNCKSSNDIDYHHYSIAFFVLGSCANPIRLSLSFLRNR